MDMLHSPLPRPAAARETVNAVLAHVSSFGDTLVSLLSGLLAACLILYSSYVLYDTAYTQVNAGNSWELLQYRPDVIDDGAAPLSGNLSAINQDYRAWLTMYETNIDYPVMQGGDDLYYASHDVYGEISLTGAIYLAAANGGNMTDSYNVIYGHHMDNGAMFGALDKYRDSDYLAAHRGGVIVTNSGVYDLTVFAVIDTDAYQSAIYSVGDRKDSVLAFLRAPSGDTTVHYFDAAAGRAADKILALSTCASADTNGRLVVLVAMNRRDLITLDATGYGQVYDGRPHGLQNVTTNYPDDAVIEYSTDGGRTWTTKPPTLTNAGTLTVLIRATSELYGTVETTEIIQINRAPLIVTVHDATKSAGSEDPSFTATVTGLVDEFQPEYTISRPGAGRDEDEGVYEDALIAEGEAIQGNYTVTYVPGDFTITEEHSVIHEPDPPLTRHFKPTGSSVSGNSWALVNLLSLLATVYLFLPLAHLREKYGRASKMRRCDEQGGRPDGLRYELERFRRRFRIGVGGELIDSVAAIVAFILTEDMRAPMILIDEWTPLMLLLLGVCWILDIRLIRYRAKEEEKTETTAVGV